MERIEETLNLISETMGKQDSHINEMIEHLKTLHFESILKTLTHHNQTLENIIMAIRKLNDRLEVLENDDRTRS